MLDTLFPEPRKKTVLTTSQLRPSGVVSSGSRVFKQSGRDKNTEIKFSDDNTKGSSVTCGPSTLEIINNIRSPSPDFGFDDMDDLIRAAPNSALDADKFVAAVDLTVDDAEEVLSPPHVPRVSRKRLPDSPPGSHPAAKRMKKISDWQGDIDRQRFGFVRSDSVQEVGHPLTDISLGHFLTWGRYIGYQINLQVSFPASVSRWEQ